MKMRTTLWAEWKPILQMKRWLEGERKMWCHITGDVCNIQARFCERKTFIYFFLSDMKAWSGAWEKSLPRNEIAPPLLRKKRTSTAMLLIINPKGCSWSLRTEKFCKCFFFIQWTFFFFLRFFFLNIC